MNLYTELYRPRQRSEIVGNTQEIDRLFSMVNSGNLTHCILEGPAGTGKTTCALVIARQLFGEFFQANFLELNASDERGINVVRETIKSFCKTNPLGDVNFKILFLDEFNLTPDAQEALRRPMEQYSQVTRFIISTNYKEKIIEPIASRCETFVFGSLAEEDILKRLEYIGKAEGLNIDTDILAEISRQADGDMRKALNKLQILASFEGKLTLDLLKKVNQTDVGQKILKSISAGRFLEARKIVRGYLSLGYTERDIINLLHQSLIADKDLSPSKKGEAILQLATFDYRLSLGVSKGLQTDALLLKLIRIFSKRKV